MNDNAPRRASEKPTPKGRPGRPAGPEVRYAHTITLDIDLRASIQNYYNAVKGTGITVPDVLRELLMRGLQIDPLETVMLGVRFRMHRLAEELLIRRAVDFARTLDKELTVYLRQAAEGGLLLNDPGELKDPDHEG